MNHAWDLSWLRFYATQVIRQDIERSYEYFFVWPLWLQRLIIFYILGKFLIGS